jgi:NAD(P)-dependent dehydrogenase (short-subunit alcohol dehydrogenase family)
VETRLRHQRVVISGGTTGIGLATARMLAGEGARILVFGRHRPELERALEAIRAEGGEAYGLTADQAEPGEVERVFAEVDARLGGLDVLVNNAATSLGSLEELSGEEIRYEVSANIGGYIVCAQEAVRRMGAGGGHIVNVGSMSADLREEGNSVYVATKSAIQGFSESLRKTVNPRGIRVTLIEPGKVDTDLVDLPGEEKERLKAGGEMLEPEDIAEAIRYALRQPPRCDVVEIRLRPIGQNI